MSKFASAKNYAFVILTTSVDMLVAVSKSMWAVNFAPANSSSA